MYVSDTEDDPIVTPCTWDHVLDVSADALSKVYFRLVFKLMLDTENMSSFKDIGKEQGF